MSRQVFDIITISTSLPRRCGIATFNGDVTRELKRLGARVHTIAMERPGQHFSYPDSVITALPQEDKKAYVRAARMINQLRPDVVLLEHEFGIYGGPEGRYVLNLLKHLTVPVLAVAHTYPFRRGEKRQLNQAKILREIGKLTHAVTMISGVAAHHLEAEFAQNGIVTPVVHIPHGTPDVTDFKVEPEKNRDVGREHWLTLSSFGLIGERKGLDDVIHILPDVIKYYPTIRYCILGGPHPADARASLYLKRLRTLVRNLGLEEHVVFVSRFLSVKEIMENLQTSEIYVTFYRDPDQASSGTLAYALAAGCCVISTPYIHAQELLAEGRGVLVPFGDRQALKQALIRVLRDTTLRNFYRNHALAYGEQTAWKHVGKRYFNLLSEVALSPMPFRRPAARTLTWALVPFKTKLSPALPNAQIAEERALPFNNK